VLFRCVGLGFGLDRRRQFAVHLAPYGNGTLNACWI
jgi:hypothetical protein